MNIKFLSYDLVMGVKTWLRSPGTVFWTLLFPVLLILIFGAIFSGADEVEYDLHIQDLDDSTTSNMFIDVLRNISAINVETISNDTDITNYMNDNDLSVVLQIPEGFQQTIYQSSMDENVTVNVSFFYDPSDQTTTSVLRSIVTGVLNEFNMQSTGGRHVVGMDDVSTLGKDFDFIDFFIPGMIGFTIMTSCVYGSIERNTKLRKDGILRKLLTMPITRAEWIFSKMLFMVFLSFISTAVILSVGVFVWGLSVKINIFFFLIVIANGFLFSGLGMIIARFVKEQESADMAGGAITFPMMFLAGTFFPLEQMPDFLQTFAQFLPLYYVNEALRNAMIYADFDKTIYFSAIVFVFAAVFFIIGVLLTKWKED